MTTSDRSCLPTQARSRRALRVGALSLAASVAAVASAVGAAAPTQAAEWITYAGNCDGVAATANTVMPVVGQGWWAPFFIGFPAGKSKTLVPYQQRWNIMSGTDGELKTRHGGSTGVTYTRPGAAPTDPVRCEFYGPVQLADGTWADMTATVIGTLH